jgi:DNA-binding NarL/FixJ family response regulator/tetratricopeptide (TPR) repeat protein
MVTPHGQPSHPVTSAAPADPAASLGLLDPVSGTQSSLAVRLRRVTGSIVGRSAELAAVEHEIDEARQRLVAVTLEGEPGVGKTRLLLAAAELAGARGFTTVAVTADEEIRGPFLLAKSLFAAASLRQAAAGTPAEEALQRVVDAISGRAEAGFESLPPETRQLRAFDLACLALGTLAGQRPLALLLDDVQWADDDSLRMLRYVVRSAADSPIFLLLTIRPAEFERVSEAVNLVADMERIGLVRRLQPGRFTQAETSELLRNLLGAPLDAPSAAAMHAQSEGVPFIVEELVRAHRDAGTLQQVGSEWRLGRNAARLVPSAVRTLIQRRAARLPATTRSVLADAALLGRTFSLRDLRAVRTHVNGAEGDVDAADELQPAVEAGLLLAHDESDPADFTFTHEQVRQFAAAELPQARRRHIHAALVDLLLEGGEPLPASLPLIAQHALAAGDNERAARFSIAAAGAALEANAPEEALRAIEQALPVVSNPEDRRALLIARDDAYATLRRPADRLTGLAELAALVEALRDPALELDVQLRRAAALRLAQDDDAAAELARRVRQRAAELGERRAELQANLELGQALTHSTIGETFSAHSNDADLDAGEEAYRRAVTLAEELGDERSLAAASRELGIINLSRGRDWYAGEVVGGRLPELVQMVMTGEPFEVILARLPIGPLLAEANRLHERALDIYERLNDRTGVMSTVIAMAYLNYTPVVAVTGSARHLEEIRRITGRVSSMVTESERARQELQMLYGIHVYALAKIVPDLMLARGAEAHRAARLAGDQAIEFAAAGGMVLAHLQLGELDEAARWLEIAAEAAASYHTPVRVRQMELWRGLHRAAAGDARGMRQHLERAIDLATQQGRSAARCEATAWLAIEAARLGSDRVDEELLGLAERAAAQVKEMAGGLPGHPPWSARADAAICQVALHRGQVERAVAAAGAAVQALMEARNEDASLDIVLPAARAILAGGPPEMQAEIRGWLQLQLARIAQTTLDESMRVRWLRGPLGRQLVELAGPLDAPRAHQPAADSADHIDLSALDEADRRVLHLLTQGSTNREIAADLGVSEEAVAQRLARLIAQLGVSTRAEATSLAFRGMAS